MPTVKRSVKGKFAAFVDKQSAANAGFNTERTFRFHPFTPTLPNPLGAFQGWHSVAPSRTTFENRVTAASGVGVLLYRAHRHAAQVRCPLLVCVSDNEDLMDPALAARVATQAPRGRAIHYPAGHFDVYFPPLFDSLVGDQIQFLQEHLG